MREIVSVLLGEDDTADILGRADAVLDVHYGNVNAVLICQALYFLVASFPLSFILGADRSI